MKNKFKILLLILLIIIMMFTSSSCKKQDLVEQGMVKIQQKFDLTDEQIQELHQIIIDSENWNNKIITVTINFIVDNYEHFKGTDKTSPKK
jgi:hypothetical protein